MLRHLTSHCYKDGASRVEVAMDYHFDGRDSACLSCRMSSKLVGYVISKGTTTFGVTEADMRKTMRDPYWRKGLATVLRGIGSFGIRKPFVPGAPFQVVWNITRACNFKCLHCYENAGSKGSDELPTREIFLGLDKLSRLGVPVIALSGGEPTVHPDIVGIVRHAHDRGMFPAMATNGWRFRDADFVKRLKRAGLGYAEISIDGVNPETHDEFRGVEGSWDAAVTAAKNCVDQKLMTVIATTVTKKNLDEIPDLIGFCRDLKVDWLMLFNFVPTGRGKDVIDMDLEPREREALLELAYRETTNGGKLQILSTAPQFARVAKTLSTDHTKELIPTHFMNPTYDNSKLKGLADFIGGCGAGRFYLSIEPNGDIYPCVFFPHRPETLVGNIARDDLDPLWRRNELLAKLRDKDALKGNCGTCDNRFICGGCRARAVNYTGDPLAADPGCIRNLADWEALHGQTMISAEEEEPPSESVTP